jgi:hypothetical protein
MHEDRKERLAEFVAWTRAHITGDEKGEAQIPAHNDLRDFPA